MSDDDMLAQVARWLEKSGRAFEVRVARTFRLSGAKPVEQAFVYDDPNSGTQREGDVLASFNWTGIRDVECSLTAVIECKSSKQEPWVGFYDRTFARIGSLDDVVYFQHARHSDVLPRVGELWIGQTPFDLAQVATHVVAAHSKDSVNPANDAIRQVVSATEARRMRYINDQGPNAHGVVLVPTVVTAAPLIACRVGETGEMDLQRVNRLTVWGHAPGGRRKQVHVVHESALDSFAASLATLAQLARDTASL